MKIYCEIEFRMGPILEEIALSNGEVAAVPLYKSNGYVVIKDGEIEGYLSTDYVSGYYDDKRLEIQLLYSDPLIQRTINEDDNDIRIIMQFLYNPSCNEYVNLNSDNYIKCDVLDNCKYFSFSVPINKFSVLENYCLESLQNDKLCAVMSIFEPVTNKYSQREIDKQLAAVKKMNMY